MGQIVVIYDRAGFSYSKNFDKSLFNTMLKFTKILQDCYAERLYKFYVLDINWFFKMIFAIVKPFIDKKTLDKICITERS